MGLRQSLFLLFVVVVQSINAKLTLEGRSRNTFDTDLYESVLDQDICQDQIAYLRQNDSLLLLTFMDAGARIPSGIFSGRLSDFGNYFDCLGINKKVAGNSIEGKYCYINVPLQQNIELPFDVDIKDLFKLQTQMQLINSAIDTHSLEQNLERSGHDNPLGYMTLSFGICIPKTCSSHDWVQSGLFNVSAIGFQIQEQFCRLPNDKPMVAADYVAIAVFSMLLIFTALSTSYDVHHTHILKKDSKDVNEYYRMFSIYTNTKRLVTFTSNPNALECLDGIRSISMMWVIICHTFSVFTPNVNILDIFKWITSAKGIWITTGFFAVDTFFTLAGILLVYSTMGKMNGRQLIKRLHFFYLNRILRMYPLLAAMILLDASLFHKLGDGPYWLNVATNTERCRHFWWSTLLFIQNYLNPTDTCLSHTWYLAVDIQLFILSPLVLFWILRGSQRSALFALCSVILLVVSGATIFNAVLEIPSSGFDRENGIDYMRLYYVNILTRAAPFLIGLLIGYILHIMKGQRFVLHKGVVVLCWCLSLGIIGVTFYTSYLVMSGEWDSQVGDILFNSYMRAGWAIALGWIIVACVKGYGGPINWFLSLDMWKLLSRISYAMYLYHYPIQFVVAGMIVTPSYFSAGSKAFQSMAFFMLSFIVSFVVTVVIDAPFSILFKIMLQGRGKQNPKLKTKSIEHLHETEVPPKPSTNL